jgi:hypothetical protein
VAGGADELLDAPAGHGLDPVADGQGGEHDRQVRYEESQTGPRRDATSLNQGHYGSPEDNPVLILPTSNPRFTQS